MPRVPDVLCAGVCGKLLWRSTSSLPEGQAMCRACRRIAPRKKKASASGVCLTEGCANVTLAKGLCPKHWREQADHLPQCSAPECDRKGASRGMCTKHYKAWSRQAGMKQAPSTGWTEAARDRYHRRRAKGAHNGDAVLLSALIERDGLTCSWCEESIDLTLAWPNRMYRSIDHVVPVSMGGEHSLDNARLLHFACNSSRGNRVA